MLRSSYSWSCEKLTRGQRLSRDLLLSRLALSSHGWPVCDLTVLVPEGSQPVGGSIGVFHGLNMLYVSGPMGKCAGTPNPRMVKGLPACLLQDLKRPLALIRARGPQEKEARVFVPLVIAIPFSLWQFPSLHQAVSGSVQWDFHDALWLAFFNLLSHRE